MAMTNTGFENHGLFPFGDKEVDTTYDEYTISGKMITAQYTSKPTDQISFPSLQSWQHFIKEKLATELARAMIRANLVSFSMQDDITNIVTHYRARCYATPDDQVRLLKSLKKR